MDISLIVTLFTLLGLTIFASAFLAAKIRLALTVAAVVCFGVATVLHLVVMLR